MALLTPNTTFKMCGVTVKEKIIPDGTRWKDASKASRADFSANSLYKKEQKLTNNTGKAKFVTIHNTDDLDRVEDDGEQYTRATYNENMGSVRVHFYVDDICAWQNMKAGTGLCPNDPKGSAEVTWHAGDGSAADGGNMTSYSMELIMNDTPEHDAKTYDNGARIAAWLLWNAGLTINSLVTHTYWVNKSAGNKFTDVDKQCTNLVKNKKWCPTYIFKSSNPDIALKNWKAFKAVVQGYMNELSKGQITTPVVNKPETPVSNVIYRVQTGAFSKKANADALAKEIKAKGFDTYIVQVDGLYKVQVGAYANKANATAMGKKLKAAGYQTFLTTKGGSTVGTTKTISKGSKVKVKLGAKTYAGGSVASWIYNNIYTVDELSGTRAVLDKNGICTAFNTADLILQ